MDFGSVMSFWSSRKVLVTGAHGFVGRNVTKELRHLGCDHVIAPKREEYDLTKEDEVKSLFEKYTPQVVIHLAGMVGGIGVNKAYPASFYYNTVMMGTLVMEYARLYKVDKLVALAAGCGYPENLQTPYKEEDFFSGFPDMNSYGYSMAKKGLVIHSLAAREQYGFNSTILLPANLYGPHDNFDKDTSHVVPALVRKFVEAKSGDLDYVTVWGSGEASREFLYVEDAVKAILDMAQTCNQTGPFNLGTGQETTIKDLTILLKDITGFSGKIKWDSTKPDGQLRRFYDMSKLKDALGYLPSTPVRVGVTWTVDWYKRHYVEEPHKRMEMYSS
jgi:GDP-L-fucose synthase